MAIGTGALANVMQRPGAFDLVVVDGEEIRRAQVLKLRRHGTLVLGYLSVGTIEDYRWWYSAAQPYRLELWGDWGEWYADVSRSGFRELIAGRVAPGMLSKGLTGLFLDNTDMVETHAAQREGMQRLVRRLAVLVHSRKRLLFTQNGQSSLGPTLRYYDGWNREDVTYSYDFDTDRYVRIGTAERRSALAAIRRVRARGLLVTTIDYLPVGRPGATAEARRNACRAGALPYVSNIGLTRVPRAAAC
jgi:polysaccharide biosynthesis protein PelA